jgi:hypothetical protein
MGSMSLMVRCRAGGPFWGSDCPAFITMGEVCGCAGCPTAKGLARPEILEAAKVDWVRVLHHHVVLRGLTGMGGLSLTLYVVGSGGSDGLAFSLVMF